MILATTSTCIVTQAFKDKLGVDFMRYHIIGACNPAIAHTALTKGLAGSRAQFSERPQPPASHDADPLMGLLLPCNIVIFEQPDTTVTMGVIDPVQQLGVTGDVAPEFRALADDVSAKLVRVAEAMQRHTVK